MEDEGCSKIGEAHSRYKTNKVVIQFASFKELHTCLIYQNIELLGIIFVFLYYWSSLTSITMNESPPFMEQAPGVLYTSCWQKITLVQQSDSSSPPPLAFTLTQHKLLDV